MDHIKDKEAGQQSEKLVFCEFLRKAVPTNIVGLDGNLEKSKIDLIHPVQDDKSIIKEDDVLVSQDQSVRGLDEIDELFGEIQV